MMNPEIVHDEKDFLRCTVDEPAEKVDGVLGVNAAFMIWQAISPLGEMAEIIKRLVQRAGISSTGVCPRGA